MAKSRLPASPSDAALLPADLAASAASAVQDILAEAASANTTRSYASALRYWAGWHQVRFGRPIAVPVSEAAVVQFIVDHISRRSAKGMTWFIVDHVARKAKTGLTWELPPAADAALVAARIKAQPGPLKLSSVTHRVAVLSSLHALKKQPNPCEQPAVRHLLSRARRAAIKRGERPSKKTARGHVGHLR